MSFANEKSKDMKNSLSKQRKKNILYLILNYFQTEGFFKTAESLFLEARLNNDLQVCDNVDLDIMYREYCNYYFMKYDKYPIICKQSTNCDFQHHEKSLKIQFTSNNKQKSLQRNKELININDPAENCMTVSKLYDSVNKESYLIQQKSSNILTSTKPKVIEDFLMKVPLEYKTFIQDIYRNSSIETNSVNWEEIIGLHNTKLILKETCVYPSKYPDLFNGLTIPWKGILLYGPPGVGKTYLAKALAHECNRFFINITPSSIISKWRGDSEKHIRILFDLARHYAPSIIFIDEIEGIVSRRDCSMEHDASRRLKTEILIELDGISKSTDNILFLVTSNLPWEIDSALLRRLEKRIHIPLPDMHARENMFKSFLRTYNLNEDIDFKAIATMTNGYSSSDIRNVCREACMSVVRILIHQMENGMKPQKFYIEKISIEVAIGKIKPAAIYNTEAYIEWSKNFSAE